MGIPQTTCYHARLCGNAKRLPVGTEAKVVFGDLRGHEAVTANKNQNTSRFFMDMTKLFITIHQFTSSPAHQLYYSSPPSRSHCGSPNLHGSFEKGHNYAHQSLAASKTLVTAVFSQVLLH